MVWSPTFVRQILLTRPPTHTNSLSLKPNFPNLAGKSHPDCHGNTHQNGIMSAKKKVPEYKHNA